MRELARQQVTTYLRRRTRVGTPWWVYGVSLAVANFIRQLVLWRLDATTAPRIISFVAMVFGVIAIVAGIAALIRRGERTGDALGEYRATCP